MAGDLGQAETPGLLMGVPGQQLHKMANAELVNHVHRLHPSGCSWCLAASQPFKHLLWIYLLEYREVMIDLECCSVLHTVQYVT